MHEVAKASTLTFSFLILSATSFSKVRYWRVLTNQRTACIETTMKCTYSLFGVIFVNKLSVDVAEHVFTNVIADKHLLKFAELL